MKISEKQFNKLSQLDRIEFRQKLDYCNIDMSISGIIWLIMILTSIFTIGGYRDTAITLLFIGVYLIILQIIFIIIGSLIKSSRQNKLCEEYFKVGVRKK